jgi:hypothetical protein
MDDQFREIEDFPGYRISRDGVVQSCWGRGRRDWQNGTWRPLKPIPRRGGYLTVNLSRSGQKSIRYIHSLVLEAFVGPRPPGLIGCHNDGDRTNNRLGNLRWDTYKANEADKVRHGTLVRGSAAGRSKLREDQVLEIRTRRSQGVPILHLAAQYGVSHQAVRAIVQRKTWRHLAPETTAS